MTEALSQEKSTIWRTKSGSIDVLIITVFITLLLLIPLFKIFILLCGSQCIVKNAKETLEIASLSTYTRMSRDSLGVGVIDMDEYTAEKIFFSQIDELALKNPSLQTLRNPDVTIYTNNGVIYIDSEAIVTNSFNQSVFVHASLEFILDPAMEAS